MRNRDNEAVNENLTSIQSNHIDYQGKLIIDKWCEFGEMSAIHDDLFKFIIQTHAVIEELTAGIITKYVIEDEYSDAAYEYVYSGMSQHHREKLLSECGILEDSIKGYLGNFRGLRNRIAHKPEMNIDWAEDDIEDRIKLSIEIVEDLTACLNTGSKID